MGHPRRFDIDRALSRGFDNHRASLSQTLPLLSSEDVIRDLQVQISHLKTKCENLELELAAQGDFKSKAELRQIFSKFRSSRHFPEVNALLMEKAHYKFPEDFPSLTTTFTGTITSLVDEIVRLAEQRNESLLSRTQDKLDRLRDVAVHFTSTSLPWWNAEKGEQFFTLCKSVAQWNSSTFHPPIEGRARCLCMNKALKGVYSVDGVNLGPLVMELLHT